MRPFYRPIRTLTILVLIGFQMIACSTSGPRLFSKRSAHEQYGQKLTDAGLGSTALGLQWFQAAGQSLTAPLTVTLPYRETGYFAADRPSATGIRFAVKRGEKITVSLEKNPRAGFVLFCDVWKLPAAGNSKTELLATFDTTGKPLELDIKEDGNYILRLQPELLKSGDYTLSVSTGPSLAFPIPSSIKAPVGSFWGAGRDAGARKHEGIDIFAPKHSPAVACADGVVTSVSQNNLGGKVVFMRPDNKNYALYYAHLDTQLVATGQTVRKGDTLGLTGNTGNARFTASHLHFGIYASGGAIDPLPFVNPLTKEPAKVSVPPGSLGKQLRSGNKTRLYLTPGANEQSHSLEANTLVRVEAGSAGWYRIALPDGQQGFVSSTETHELREPLRRLTLRSELPVFDQPDSAAPRKAILPAGRPLEVLAAYKNYYFVRTRDSLWGWVTKPLQP